MRPILITGFEPFDRLDRNPSAEVVRRLEGRSVDGRPVVGRILPVSLRAYRPALAAALSETGPALVIALGLAQGAASVRVERVGLNLADFGIADNDGTRAVARPIEDAGPDARFATIPVDRVVRRLLEAGIPAHVSNSAGAYLCNACLYSLVGMAEGRPCGFIHLPYLPEQVAARLAADPRASCDTPSMSLDMMVRAVELAISASLPSGSAAATI